MTLKTKHIISYFFFYLLLLNNFNSDCFGQPQTILKKIDQTIGLSNDRVSSIVKEKNGFVWIGTENGLNRFDGTKIKIYNKQNSGLSSNDISDLLIDQKGRIWIGTLGGGLNLYDPSNDKFIGYKNNVNNKNSIPSNELRSWLIILLSLSFSKKRSKSSNNTIFIVDSVPPTRGFKILSICNGLIPFGFTKNIG